jgi:hypothetical protein
MCHDTIAPDPEPVSVAVDSGVLPPSNEAIQSNMSSSLSCESAMSTAV